MSTKRTKWKTEMNQKKQSLLKPQSLETPVPRVSYKKAFVLIGVIFLALWVLPIVANLMKISPLLATVIVGAPVVGLTTAKTLVQKKDNQYTKWFYWLATIVTVVVMLMTVLMYGGIML